MALTKKQREKIPATHFAVPETEQLPIEDEVHVKMAWNVVDKTKGLSDAQRKSARERILDRAKELGMDTSGWSTEVSADADDESDEKIKRDMEVEQEEHEMHGKSCAVRFSALAMEIPDQVSDHPNQTPFKGVLTKLDEPSDNPLSGSAGKRVILPKSVAEKGLSSLLGMAIDATPDFDGHDVKRKIGLITDADIVGNEIHIAGYFYGADFPEEVKRIQAEKSQLGFSYEAQVHLRSMNDDPLVMKNCVFTGAAVLYKDMAAYTTTSLAANAASNQQEIDQMNIDELKKMLEAMSEKITGLETKLAANAEATKVAAGNISALVKPHTDALRACADGMMAKGMGMHASKGHVAVLHGMADQMDADAALGKMPHVYQTDNWFGASKEVAKQDDSAITALSAKLDEMTTKITDLSKANFSASAEPERKTLRPEILKLLAKNGIAHEEGKKLDTAAVDKALKDTSMTVQQRLHLKLNLQEAGQLN